MNSGDLVFCHSEGIVGWGIRTAERFRRDASGSEAAGARWNHVCVLDRLLDDGDWTVIQAEGCGVTEGAPLSQVAPGGSYEVLRLPGQLTRAKVLTFARAQVGRRYGFVTIASILVTLFTPRFFNVMLPGTWICSAVAAESWRFAGWYHDWPDIYQVSPAQLWVALRG